MHKVIETVNDGHTWFGIDAETSPYNYPPDNFTGRYNHQSLVDTKNRLWIIGGKTIENGTTINLNEVWIVEPTPF